MSSITRITLALFIMLGSCFLMTFGIVRGLVVRANMNNPQLPTVVAGQPTPDGAIPGLTTGTTPEGTSVFPPVPTSDVPQPTQPPIEVTTAPPANTTTADPLQDVGNAFLSAVQQNDYDSAYALLDVETATAIASPDNLRVLMIGISFNGLTGWQFTQQQQVTGDTTNLLGVVALANGMRSDVKLEMRYNGAQWRVKWFYNNL
ncbi:MAG: hypothetical protein KF716_21590 [Anaerolineae bacterium]|nr:hypothetical protein [Anaerolineae bacterium]